MKRSPILAVVAPALLLLAGMGFQSVGAPEQPQVFDPAAMVTFEGEVLAVTESEAGAGIHLLVRDADGQEVEVRVGPAQYLAEQGFELSAGDEVEVRGVSMLVGDTPTFVAAAIARGEDHWMLRDESGQPAWAQSGMRGSVAGGMGAQAGRGGMMGGQGGEHGGMMGGGGRGMGMHHGEGAGAMHGRSTRGQGMGMQGCNGMQAGETATESAPMMCRRRAGDDGAAAESSALPNAPASESGCQCGCAMRGEAQR